MMSAVQIDLNGGIAKKMAETESFEEKSVILIEVSSKIKNRVHLGDDVTKDLSHTFHNSLLACVMVLLTEDDEFKDKILAKMEENETIPNISGFNELGAITISVEGSERPNA